jgi:hypothetical protein
MAVLRPNRVIRPIVGITLGLRTFGNRLSCYLDQPSTNPVLADWLLGGQ